ncbi:MAG: Hpt domain-containing protein [Steroidobacteraceae bacterium]
MSRLIGFIAQARAPRARDGHASLGVSMFAHRLHGAALVFEYPQVAAAAKSMELAVAAAGAQAPVAELVEEAMQALLEQLRLATSASPAMPREHSGFQLVRAPVLPPVTETRGPGHMGVPVGGWSGTTPTR